jgi:hypothetical protein
MIGDDVKKGRLPVYLKELKAKYARENGTIKNLEKGKPYRFFKGDKRAGVYIRSEETLQRLRRKK